MGLTERATAADLAAVIRPVDENLAASLIESSPIITTIYDGDDTDGRETAHVLALTATWLKASRTRPDRPLHLSATVIQTTIGGTDGAVQHQHVARGILTPDEARTVAALVAAGLLPQRATWKEL